jgi:hypothetical protein
MCCLRKLTIDSQVAANQCRPKKLLVRHWLAHEVPRSPLAGRLCGVMNASDSQTSISSCCTYIYSGEQLHRIFFNSTAESLSGFHVAQHTDHLNRCRKETSLLHSCIVRIFVQNDCFQLAAVVSDRAQACSTDCRTQDIYLS